MKDLLTLKLRQSPLFQMKWDIFGTKLIMRCRDNEDATDQTLHIISSLINKLEREINEEHPS